MLITINGCHLPISADAVENNEVRMVCEQGGMPDRVFRRDGTTLTGLPQYREHVPS